MIAVIVAAVLGGAGSADAPEFYARLVKPAWAPPVWVFGPAWTVLYALMAVAAARVARTPEPARGRALVSWWVQLGFNVGWTWCFFFLQSGRLAVVEAVALWIAVVVAAITAARADRIAGLLLLPYAAWVAFAVALTWAIAVRTPWL